MNKIKITARTSAFDAHVDFATVEERDAFVALFPKFVGVKASFVGTLDQWDDLKTAKQITLPTSFVQVSLTANGTNGGRNETGIKRALRYLAVVDALEGFEVVFTDRGDVLDREAFLAAIAA